MKIKLSKNLDHTWFIDIDGTILKHNGYIDKNKDKILQGVKKFFSKIPKKDKVILTTSRKNKYKKRTIQFLKKNKIKFDNIIFNLPYGERILINDIKPNNRLKTSVSINVIRDKGLTNLKF